MNLISINEPITADGEFKLPGTQPGTKNILEIYGEFDGATVTVGYVDPAGDFVAYKVSTGGADVTTSEPESYILHAPASGRYAVSVASSGASTSIKLKHTRAQ